MAYTPINWQTGDTITADKLNRCDNGWGYESTQLFSETVTTVDDGSGVYNENLAYTGDLTANTIIVTYDGTEYTCPSIGEGEYGAPYNDGNPDFSVYPFNLFKDGVYVVLTTQTAGEHAIAAGVPTLAISTAFQDAVNACVGALPMRCVVGETSRSEMNAARDVGRMMYVIHSGISYFVSYFSDGVARVTVTPAPTGINFEFGSNDILTYGES